jgi:predicted acylesterase/phospholipase RssA
MKSLPGSLRPLWGLLLASSALAQAPCDPNVPRALVLSGGGSRGAFEAGAMYHLIVHRGCDFVDIAGVSVGGLNASFVGAAPTGINSQKKLQDQTKELVTAWRNVPGPEQFLIPRFLGPVRMALFGIESLYDFEPARKWIGQHIDPDAIHRSGRNVRIGTVNFYDGRYHEITPGTPSPLKPPSPELLGNLDLYREFVLGGALIPVFGEMPRIRGPKDDNDSEDWPQYADGGLRHQTPLPGYFDPCDILTTQMESPQLSEIERTRRPNCLYPRSAPQHEKVQELMVVMSAPYDPRNDEIGPPPEFPKTQNRKHVKDGRKILERTVMDIVLDSPYRWDAGFTIVANHVLKWRADLYDSAKGSLSSAEFAKFKTIFDLKNKDFPVESFNSDLEVGSRPYNFGIVCPTKRLGAIYGFDRKEIRRQLNEGCLSANKMMVDSFQGQDQESLCIRDLPLPFP